MRLTLEVGWGSRLSSGAYQKSDLGVDRYEDQLDSRSWPDLGSDRMSLDLSLNTKKSQLLRYPFGGYILKGT